MWDSEDSARVLWMLSAGFLATQLRLALKDLAFNHNTVK